MRGQLNLEPDDEIDDDDLTERIAFHEAGHIVMAKLLHAPLGAASALPGYAFSSSGNTDAIREAWSMRGWTQYLDFTPEIAICAISLAGICSEAHFCHIDMKSYDGADADFALVYRLTRGDHELANSIISWVRDCINQFADIIDAVAVCLRCQLYITGQTLESLVDLFLENRGRRTLQ
jgi:hypothetical protein